jgi:hypothetical protein
MAPWWSPLLGVGVGFLLARVYEWFMARFRNRGHWRALRAELQVCRERAKTYETDAKAAPLYRLPIVVFPNSFPALLTDAAVDEDAARALIECYSEVESLNRGLDLIQEARERNDQQALLMEYDRNRLKAQRLFNESCPRALEVVNSRCRNRLLDMLIPKG